MEFGELRAKAFLDVKSRLHEPMSADRVIIHVWRCLNNQPDALERWVFNIFPEISATEAIKKVAKEGNKAWDKSGTGAQMNDEGWKVLQKLCSGKSVKLDPLVKKAMPNLYALLGAEYTAQMIEAAGGLQTLARMTQRDCMRLGNESGTFGGKQKKSILEKHDLCTHDRALRVLSSRVVLAARLDAFKGQFKGESLRQEVLYAQ